MRIAAMVGLTVSCGPQATAITEAQRTTILRWLVCDECIAGERDSVRALGPGAVSYIAETLDSVPAVILEPLRIHLAKQWSPQIHPDSAEYVNFFLDNARAKTRVRAARSLGDLEAAPELQQALADGLAANYRDDVILAIRGALAAAQNQGIAPVDTLIVSPSPHTMAVGQSIQMIVSAQDTFGNVVPAPPVVWNSSAPAIAVASATGLVTATAAGSVIIQAVSSVDPTKTGHAALAVSATGPAPLVVSVMSGNLQAQSAGTTLSSPLRVAVTTPGGSAVSGVAVTWTVLVGGGTVTPIAAGGRGGGTPGMTNAAGVAAANFLLGPSGNQLVEARVVGSPAVVFRANAN
jgi:uncharacterized protein YjdB